MYPLNIAWNILGILGYVSWIGKVADRDATLTEILIECGAVLYVRTNVPQTLMVRFFLFLSLWPFSHDPDGRI